MLASRLRTDDFKLKFEQAQKELADVRSELDAAAEAQKPAEDKAHEAAERTARLQADWEELPPSYGKRLAWRSASALPRSSCAPCCRWSTTSSVLSITLALWIWPMTSASS